MSVRKFGPYSVDDSCPVLISMLERSDQDFESLDETVNRWMLGPTVMVQAEGHPPSYWCNLTLDCPTDVYPMTRGNLAYSLRGDR
jgi:hypothetical protein